MASGFGFHGGEGRCYQFWRDVEDCTKESKLAGACEKQVEDYLECLHHRKKFARDCAVDVVKEKKLKAQAHPPGPH